MTEKASVYHVAGYADADAMRAKSDLVLAIKDRLRELGIESQADAAERMGMDKADVSRLLRGIAGGFTIDRILKAYKALDEEAEVRVVLSKKPTHAAESGEFNWAVGGMRKNVRRTLQDALARRAARRSKGLEPRRGLERIKHEGKIYIVIAEQAVAPIIVAKPGRWVLKPQALKRVRATRP